MHHLPPARYTFASMCLYSCAAPPPSGARPPTPGRPCPPLPSAAIKSPFHSTIHTSPRPPALIRPRPSSGQAPIKCHSNRPIQSRCVPADSCNPEKPTKSLGKQHVILPEPRGLTQPFLCLSQPLWRTRLPTPTQHTYTYTPTPLPPHRVSVPLWQTRAAFPYFPRVITAPSPTSAR